MQALLPQLWCLISVGAPHLGQLYNGNLLLAAGMGVLKAMRKGEGVCTAGRVGEWAASDAATVWFFRSF
jgi:hypothetical protein